MRPRRQHRSLGQAATEFALIAPLFLVLMLGLMEVGRAVFYYNIISNAAREGAREAILAYNQCSNATVPTAPCSGPPSGSSLVGVESAIKRAGGGAVGFNFNNADQATDTGNPVSCTPSANRGCVFIFLSGGAKAASCRNSAGNPDTGPGPNDHYSLCNFNTSKSSGANDVVVEVEYKFQPLVPLLNDYLGNSLILWAKSEMRAEY